MHPEECIFFMIAKASQNAQKIWSRRASKHNLTPVQAMVLNFLKDDDHVTIRNLGEKLNIDNATMTGIIDRLESSGLIKRVTDLNDRRSYLIALTGEGRKLASLIYQDMLQANKEFMKAFTKNDLKSFKEFLSRVRNMD